MNKFKLLLILCFKGVLALSQEAHIKIEKEFCVIQDEYEGYKLRIILNKNDSLILSDPIGYDLDLFFQLKDSVKLIIIKKLLMYENDTSLCCSKVVSFVEGVIDCTGRGYKSKRFNMQIDALFMINSICFSYLTDRYACAPVLYDKKKKIEINDCPDLIKKVYKNYKKWYLECKRKGKIGRYFPFNDGRYVWFGGRGSMFPKE